VEDKVDGLSFLEQVGRIDHFLIDKCLFESIGIHKIIGITIVIQILMWPSFDPDYINLDTGNESIFKYAAITEVFYLGPDKGSSFTGFYVLKFYDRPKVIVKFNAQSIPEIRGCWHNTKV
jgi:hypothetical protein